MEEYIKGAEERLKKLKEKHGEEDPLLIEIEKLLNEMKSKSPNKQTRNLSNLNN